MSPAERSLWLQVQRAIQRLRPDLSDALIDAWDLIREALPSTPKLRDMVVAGDIDGIARAVLSDDTATQAFQRVRTAIRLGVERSAIRAESVLPKAVQPKVGVRFDVLNPEIARALQTLEGETMTRLSTDVREAVRQAVARGIERGESPLVTARAIRDVIGLTPRQELIVDNYRRELRGERTGDPLSRALRDRRFDARTAKGALTEAQIDQQVDAYRRRILNRSADVYATTVSGQAQRLGGQATWKQAQESLGGNGTVMKKWHHSPIPEEPRPEHVAMDGVEVPVDQPYPNGDMYPGEHDPWNCFVAGTIVEGAFLVGLKSGYSGTIREVVTARGYRLTVTPNHPILTDNGWVAAGKLKKGDCLFSKFRDVDFVAPVGVDHQYGPLPIEDVFNALGAQRTLPPGVAMNLHGDARRFVGDVDIVGPDGIFAHERGNRADDCVNERGLLYAAPDGAATEHGFGSRRAFDDGALTSSRLIPCGAEQPNRFDSVATDTLPPETIRCGSAAEWDAPVPQVFGDGATSVAGFFLQLQEASAFAITPDEVVSVRDYSAQAVHVYDLQSVNGWLLASNIVCSNCRCVETYSIKYHTPALPSGSRVAA